MIFKYTGTEENKAALRAYLNMLRERDGLISTLTIARMQGFHNGHKRLLDFQEEIGDLNLLGLGSCQEERTEANPYTPSERIEIIRLTKGFDKRFSGKLSIIKLKDLGAVDVLEWKENVLTILSTYGGKGFPRPNVFLAGCEADIMKNGFHDDPSILAISLERLTSGIMSGTDVRNGIKHGLDSWRNHVPFVVQDYMLQNFPKELLLSEQIKKN